ncbi:hypothetical protein LSTR_LSTR008660 [Laodelphax striatellus]|uniref:Ribosomal L1 domain-containing protein 1 n=1 Tax=Laodelphax striatellus TaxID=195883 RepID=A0A482X5Z3_LAOST|nr:hypothetical protein LSTR_LSTR008660 [Laodelphax striatellus]
MKISVTSQSPHKSSGGKPSKIKGKKNDKLSPELRLGLGIEKLLEQGVRVDRIDDVVNNSNGRSDKVPIKKGFARATNKNICLVKAKSKRRRRRFITINGKRERVSKLKKKQAEKEDPTVTNFEYEMVKNAVEACLKNLEQFQSDNQLLDEGVPLNLHISCIRKPIMSKRFIRFQLPNSYVDDLADVCLIVPDQKSWNNKLEDPELTINETQDFLRANDVTCVKKIITLQQLKTDYMMHEMRRKLCNSYDYFLVDNRLTDEIHTHLGKLFQKQKKGPVPIKMHRGNFKNRLDKALAKSVMKLSSEQDTFACRIGHTKQDTDQLVENIVAVGQQLDTIFPGKFENVRSVSIKSTRSIGFPIYYSTRPVNNVPRPIVAPKRPRLYEVATDELSTIGKQVQVHPDGTVTVIGDQHQAKKSKKKQNAKKAQKSPAKKNEKESKEDVKQEEEAGKDDDDEQDSDLEFEIDSNDDDFDDNVEEEVDSDSNSPFTFEKKKKSIGKKDADGSDESGTDESDTEDEDFSRKTEEAYLQSLGGDSDSEEEDNDDNGEEEKKEEVKEIEVKDQKKRKTIENKDAKNVSPKKIKPNAPAEQPSSSKVKGNINPATSKQNNPPRNKQKAKAVKRKTFDTSLGETWSIKKKCDAPAGEKVVAKKKNRSKSKLNKSQKKGNMKMKKAKQNKD